MKRISTEGKLLFVVARQLFKLLNLILFVQILSAEQFVLTETELAKNLGLSKKELMFQTKQLGKYLSGYPALIQSCKKNSDSMKSLCKLVLSFETFKDEDKRFESKKVDDFDDYTGNPAPRVISARTITQAQSASVQDLLRVMKDYKSEEIFSWLPKLLIYEKCPQNLLLASLRMYETSLPSAKAQASIEVGYKKALTCLTDKNPNYEITHFRQGLLRLYWGDRNGAQFSLKQALRATNPRYKENVLYWLGFSEKNQKIRRAYWEHLIEEHPLSFHSLSASKMMGRNIFEEFLKKPLIKPQRNVSDPVAQLGTYWLEALYMYGETKNAMTMSYRLSKRLFTRYSSANMSYIAALADRYNLPGESMQFASFIVRRNPYLLTPQTMRYMYPKPFQSSFEKSIGSLDPLLTFSVAKQESAFNPYARSPANARGLLQVLPSTAKMYDPGSQKFLYDINTNVDVGSKILKDLISKLGRVEFALAAYNAGYNKVDAWKKRYETIDQTLFIDLIPYAETRGYVANVLRNHYWYTALYKAN